MTRRIVQRAWRHSILDEISYLRNYFTKINQTWCIDFTFVCSAKGLNWTTMKPTLFIVYMSSSFEDNFAWVGRWIYAISYPKNVRNKILSSHLDTEFMDLSIFVSFYTENISQSWDICKWNWGRFFTHL